MYCSICDNKKNLKKKKITHKYKECGLDNVTLIGVDVYHCDICGEEYFNFGNIEELHCLIATILIQKSELLTGDEVRFLRKYLGYSIALFASLIGYDQATLSRLERSSQAITRTFDRLIRFTVASKLINKVSDLHEQILQGGIKLNRIELTIVKNGLWKMKAA